MASHTAARLKQLLTAPRISGGLVLQFAFYARLPDESSYGLDFIRLEPEGRHLGGGTEVMRVFYPYRQPFLAGQLDAQFLPARPDLFHLPEQAARFDVERLHLLVHPVDVDANLIDARLERGQFRV